MIAGILNINKPAGVTSHDVVNAVRRATGTRKVGHAGSLDPMATGVLVICVGRATRLSEYVSVSDKSYRATVRLGVETDTYDADGQAVRSSSVAVGRDEVEAALGQFRGIIAQVPPMYSAVKKAGQPLYKLARSGIMVQREPRSAFVSHIALTEWCPPEFCMEVTCSAGTYVRSLAHDLGQKLGCGAHLTRLTRIRCGRFDLEESVTLNELTAANWQSSLLPMEVAVADFPRLTLDAQAAERLIHGQPVPRRPEHPVADLVRAHTTEGAFLALVKPSNDGSGWLPHKVFA